jgi:hypothetical protein
VLAYWDAFRAQLANHNSAEDDDLCPVLRRELSDLADLAAVEAMKAEHRQLPAPRRRRRRAARRRRAGDTRRTPFGGPAGSPGARRKRRASLIEQHLTRAQWRAFLHKERVRRSLRERPEFLAWILDDAGQQDARAVLTEMPPPARLIYRRVSGPDMTHSTGGRIPFLPRKPEHRL